MKACPFSTASTGRWKSSIPAAKEKLKFNEALKRLLDALVTDLIESTRLRLAVKRIQSLAQVRASRVAAGGAGTANEAGKSEVKDFLFARLYSHRERQLRAQAADRLHSQPFCVLLETPAKPARLLLR